MTMLDLESLLRVPYVEPDSGFEISPDGTQVAFSWNRTGQWEIYRLRLDGNGEPQQLTGGPGGKFNPRWSPDGGCVAYVLDLDGSEAYDLYVCDLNTGQHANLTPDTPHALQPNFAWSPDGKEIAFLSDLGGRFDTYLMPASGLMQASGAMHTSGGEARLVLSTPHPDWDVDWSPCGHWLAIVSEAEGQDYWTTIVPAQGGEPRIVGTASGPICAKDSRWSPDGRRLAFASDVRGRFEIGLYELATGEIRWLTQGEGDKEGPAWASDGSRLTYVVSHGPVTELGVLELDGGKTEGYRVAPGVHYRPRFTADGQRVILVFDNPGHPCDLWQLRIADGSLRQLTYSLPAGLRNASFALPRQVRYPSLDGTSVPALFYQPDPSDEPPPAVIYIHGGPNWLTQVTWDPLVQHMVSRGWAVLAPNYRGSTGYGREWQLANRFDLGGCDTEDVVAGADYLVREGLADPARIVVTGRSWGGYLTMTAMTGYPSRWAGGSAVVPFLNWFTSHANSREDLQHWDRENFGDPERDRELYYERSPFFFLERIAAPVQMICGAHDVRCPPSESVQARDRLLALGKVCDLALYEDEGHSFLKIENVIGAKGRQVAFLSQLLERIMDKA